jgi:hypothetical protein
LGVYRFWRDLAFVFGAVGIGFIADTFDLNTATMVAWNYLGVGNIYTTRYVRDKNEGHHDQKEIADGYTPGGVTLLEDSQNMIQNCLYFPIRDV